MSLEIKPTNPQPGQMVTATAIYAGPDPKPTDMHIDVLVDGAWRGVVEYPTIPAGLDPSSGISIRFSLGHDNIPGPGSNTYQVRWTWGPSNPPVVDPPVVYPPEGEEEENDEITKEEVQEVLWYIFLFGILTPIGFPAGLVLAGTYAANEIAAAMSKRKKDQAYAEPTKEPAFELAYVPADGFSAAVNERLAAAHGAQLAWCRAIFAACAATSRYYAAVAARDEDAAADRLKEIKRYVERGRVRQQESSDTLAEAGRMVLESRALAIDPARVRELQAHVLEGGFPRATERALREQIAHVDPAVRDAFDLHALLRRFVLGARIHDPLPLGPSLLAAATAMRSLDRVIGPFPGVHELEPRIEKKGKKKKGKKKKGKKKKGKKTKDKKNKQKRR